MTPNIDNTNLFATKLPEESTDGEPDVVIAETTVNGLGKIFAVKDGTFTGFVIIFFTETENTNLALYLIKEEMSWV